MCLHFSEPGTVSNLLISTFASEDAYIRPATAEPRTEVRRLMTVPGVDMTVAVAIKATVGDFSRFASPAKLVSYVGLDPKVRQSGGLPAIHGRISKQAWARGMLVEAAWVAAKTPGPLRGFHERIKTRRGFQVATVATARKLLVICWHLVHDETDYAFARPSLTAKKIRALELRAGDGARKGHRGAAASYSLKTVRDRERAVLEQAETAYRHVTGNWQPTRPHGKARPASPAGARPTIVPSGTARAVKASPPGGPTGPALTALPGRAAGRKPGVRVRA